MSLAWCPKCNLNTQPVPCTNATGCGLGDRKAWERSVGLRPPVDKMHPGDLGDGKPYAAPREPGQQIINALMHLRYALEAAGCEPPASVNLTRPQDGMYLKYAVSQAAQLWHYCGPGRTVAVDGEIWSEAELCGIKVRWPVRVYAMGDGAIGLKY